jgi:hypothetical protein
MIHGIWMQGGVVVIDSHGAWMHSFKSDVERLGVDVMRMPVNIHPSPKPLALKYYAEKHARSEVSLISCGVVTVCGFSVFMIAGV